MEKEEGAFSFCGIYIFVYLGATGAQ